MLGKIKNKGKVEVINPAKLNCYLLESSIKIRGEEELYEFLKKNQILASYLVEAVANAGRVDFLISKEGREILFLIESNEKPKYVRVKEELLLPKNKY